MVYQIFTDQTNYNIVSADFGEENAYLWTSSFTVPEISVVDGGIFILDSILVTNTGISTLQIGGNAALPITTPDLQPLVGGEILSGNNSYAFMVSNSGGSFILLNSSLLSPVGATPAQVQHAVLTRVLIQV